MHRAISVSVDTPIEQVMPIVADLATYPSWLGLVHLAEPVIDGGTKTGSPTGAVFMVTLRAKLGPFARSKKLRMVRTKFTDTAVQFDREETDGREHSNWTMTIDTEARSSGGTDLEIALNYDGDLWSAPLELILDSQADKAGRRLDDYAATVS